MCDCAIGIDIGIGIGICPYVHTHTQNLNWFVIDNCLSNISTINLLCSSRDVWTTTSTSKHSIRDAYNPHTNQIRLPILSIATNAEQMIWPNEVPTQNSNKTNLIRMSREMPYTSIICNQLHRPDDWVIYLGSEFFVNVMQFVVFAPWFSYVGLDFRW